MNLLQLIVCLVVYFSGYTDGELLQTVPPKDYFFLEGAEISFTCLADGIDGNYTIEWSDAKDGATFINGTKNVKMISNALHGSKLTSIVTFHNSITLSKKRYIIHCRLMKDGTMIGKSKMYDYRPLRLNDLPKVTLSSNEVKVDYSQNITLTCTVQGDLGLSTYALDITWSKDGQIVKKSKQTTNGDVAVVEYTIKEANGSSGGEYICRAAKFVRVFTLQSNATVTVSVFPKLVGEESKEVYGIVGNSVKMLCDIDGYPMTINWQRKKKGTFQDFPVINSNNRFELEDNGKVLTTNNFQSEDAAEFVCKTKDKDNNDIIQTTSLITRDFPHVKNGSKSKVNVTLTPGNATILRCAITGVPAPCVSWIQLDSKKTRDVSDIPGVIAPAKCQNTLELRNFSALQNGQVFSCTADGEVSQSFSIRKMTKPRLIGSPTKEVKSDEGDDVSWKCDVEVNPLDIQWFVGDRLLTGSSKKYVISTSDPREFTVNDVDKSDRGSFYCVAKNALLTTGVKQKIILRVKNPNDWVWPVIGTLIVIVLVVFIIGIATYRQRRRNRERDAQDAKDARELQEATATHQEDGDHGTALLLNT